ncbi:MAG: IPT/TIG domain-containing protein, partial [Proteobacteria bacterium]|nr:IPT/TIG domain-containing protein [Pseudomonadota bacterium]
MTAVRLAQTVVLSVVSYNSNGTEIVVVATALLVSSDLVGDIGVTSNSGQQVVGQGMWTYKVPGNMETVGPAQGSNGTIVTVTGTNLLGYGNAVVNASLAGVGVTRIRSFNNSVVVLEAAMAPSGTPSGDVTWTTDTGSVVSLQDGTARASLVGGVWRYVAAPVISGVSPSIGQVNTRVTITGTGLHGGGSAAVTVTLAGVVATSIVSDNATQIVVIAGASNSTSGSAGTVVVISDTGATVSASGLFQYATPGVISSVVPGSGQVGTLVTISGSGLFGSASNVSTVQFGTVSCSVVSASDTQIVVAVGSGGAAGLADVLLTSTSGSTVRSVLGWTQLAEGLIASATPSVGQAGTVVTITGTGLLGGGTSVVAVQLQNVSVSSIVSFNDTVVVVVCGPGAAGPTAGNVVLTANTGAVVTKVGGFQYLSNGVITQVQPSSGQYGTVVAILGQRLLGGGSSVASVTLGGSAASLVVGGAANDTRIDVVAGTEVSGPGPVAVVVTSSSGSVVSAVLWTWLTRGSIATVQPGYGQAGTRVTISGTGLLGGGSSVASLTLAGVAVQQVVSSTNSQIVVIASASGSASNNVLGNTVIVADTGAIVTKSSSWQYLDRPVISLVTPSSGQAGTVVNITGTGLLGGGLTTSSVTLAGVAVASIVSVSNTEIVVVAGAGAATVGDVVVVSDSSARANLSLGFTYVAVPTITTVVPGSGIVGTLVTISGTGLLGGGSQITTVTLGGVNVEQIVSYNATSIVVKAAAGPVGAGLSVQAVANTGAFVVQTNSWAYVAGGNVTLVSPNYGQAGTIVTITGARLFGDGTTLVNVTLAGTPVSSIVSSSASQVIVVAAASAAVTGDVVLTCETGGRVTAVGGWTYQT